MRFKEVLKKYGISQAELAEKLSINRVSVSRLFRDTNDMRASTLIKIADAVGCDVGEFFREPPSEIDTSAKFIFLGKIGSDLYYVTSPEELQDILDSYNSRTKAEGAD